MITEHTVQYILLQVMNRTTMLGIGHYLYIYQRYKVVDFLQPLNSIDILFFTGKPKKESASLNILKPFQHKVWISSMAMFIAVAIVGIIFTRLQGLSFQRVIFMPIATLSHQSKYKTQCKINLELTVCLLSY